MLLLHKQIRRHRGATLISLSSIRFWPLALNALYCFIFAIPLSRAFLDGIASARDPMHRLIPDTSPWVFFKRKLYRHLRIWIPIWLLVLVWVFFTMLYDARRSFMLQPSQTIPIISDILLGFSHMGLVLSTWFLILAAVSFLAPKCERTWTLVSLGFISAVISVSVLWRSVTILLPRSMMTVSFDAGQNTRWGIDISTSYLAAVCFLIPIGAWLWIRRQNEKWFRFEE